VAAEKAFINGGTLHIGGICTTNSSSIDVTSTS
jgi:hypothetical protein